MNLQELINYENEEKLLKEKLRMKLKERGIAAYIVKHTNIGYDQLSRFKKGAIEFSRKRLLQIARIIIKKEGKL